VTQQIRAYPLAWPDGWRRTNPSDRNPARFRRASKKDWQGNWQYQRELTIAEATLRVRRELQRMGILDDDIVISTNLVLRLDGGPRSGQSEPSDPGVAVYWQRRGESRCIAVDQYTKVTGNLAAIAATLDAMRAIERHGGAEILDRAFTGFVALAGPTPWWVVLDVKHNATRDDIEAAYLRKRSAAHPDRGGSPDAFQAVTHAYQQAINRT
jgi:hypothetical protein